MSRIADCQKLKHLFPLIDNIQWGKLVSDSSITPQNLILTYSMMDEVKSGLPLTQVNLYYYIDKCGSFQKPPILPHKLIAKAIFESMNVKDKMAVAQYTSYILNGDDDDE